MNALEEALNEVELAKMDSNIADNRESDKVTTTHIDADTNGNTNKDTEVDTKTNTIESTQTDTTTDTKGDTKTETKITTHTHSQHHLPIVEDRHRSGGYKKGGRRVLCAVDPSHHSRVAFEWYLRNIWKSGDLVMIVYCPEPPHLPSFCIKDGLSLPTDRWREIISETNHKVRNLENDYEGICLEKKLKYIIRVDMSKHPGEEIIRLVEKEVVDMIVMGCRGVGAVKRFFLGSVSEYVTRHSKVPCVVVPNEGTSNQH